MTEAEAERSMRLLDLMERRMALIHQYASGQMNVPRREALRRIKELSGGDE